MDIVTPLHKENTALKSSLLNSDAEKIALDQSYLISVKENVMLRKSLILMEHEMNKKNSEIEDLKTQLTKFESERTSQSNGDNVTLDWELHCVW